MTLNSKHVPATAVPFQEMLPLERIRHEIENQGECSELTVGEQHVHEAGTAGAVIVSTLVDRHGHVCSTVITFVHAYPGSDEIMAVRHVHGHDAAEHALHWKRFIEHCRSAGHEHIGVGHHSG